MGNISILSREEIGRDYTEARTLKRKQTMAIGFMYQKKINY